MNTMSGERFFLPAEWEPHEATWLAWPHGEVNWPGKLAAVCWAFAEMVRRLAPGERVRIIVQDAAHEARARDVLSRAAADLGQVDFFHFPTDRGWARDMGPIFLRRGSRRGSLAIADFRFNGWARYPDFQRDDRVASLAAEALGIPRICPVVEAGTLSLSENPANYEKRFVLEGGAIDVNGHGTLLSTEQCLLDNSQQARNPELTREQIDQALCETLGASNIFYLPGGIAGDDTGGHVDDLCRFVNPQTVVILTEENPNDVNYRAIAMGRERLEDLRLEDGSRPEVVELPSPEPLMCDGLRLPASYANFYIANAVVLVPTFNDPSDRLALGTLAELFPSRKVVGIHAVDLVRGFGTVHCLTQQQPSIVRADSGT
jgi:agmatine deiminase